MAQVGAESMRFQISWPAIQQTAGGPYDWSTIDAQVAGAASAGLTPLPFVYGTPTWAANCSNVSADLCNRVLPTKSEAGSAGWHALLSAAVARYGPNGSFWSDPTDGYSPPYVPIRTWQIGNEANSFVFAPPRPSVGAYYRLLKISRSALRSGDGHAKLMLAGLFGLPSKPGLTLSKFLNKLYQKKNAKEFFDFIAVHPYAPNLRKLIAQLEDAREAAVRNKDKKTPIVVTEIGWGSAERGSVPKPLGRLLKGERGQAMMLRHAFKQLIKERKRLKLTGVYWFTWRDTSAGSGGRCYLCESAGLLSASGGAKPSLSAYARIAG